MAVRHLNNVLIVVDDLEVVKSFFIDLGLRVEGEQTWKALSWVNSLDCRMCGPPW